MSCYLTNSPKMFFNQSTNDYKNGEDHMQKQEKITQGKQQNKINRNQRNQHPKKFTICDYYSGIDDELI